MRSNGRWCSGCQPRSGFFQGQLLGHHQRDLGQLDGEFLDVQTEELAGADQRRAAGQLADPVTEVFVDLFQQFQFQTLQLAIGDVQEVAAAAGRVEDVEAEHRLGRSSSSRAVLASAMRCRQGRTMVGRTTF